MGYILDHNEEPVEVVFGFDFHKTGDEFSYHHPADFTGNSETILKFVIFLLYSCMIRWS
jgi:hypothetical protein